MKKKSESTYGCKRDAKGRQVMSGYIQQDYGHIDKLSEAERKSALANFREIVSGKWR